MADEAKFPDVPGAADLFAWFGFWPNFHDGEVLSVHLDRAGPSHLRVHTWERTNELDNRRYYVLRKHVVVTFILEDIRLELGPCFGLNGTITARSVRIELEAGKPS